MHVIKVYKGINERKEIMKQIIENLMKHTRHAELDSASQVNPLLSLRDTLPQGRENTLCAIPTSKSTKSSPTSTGRTTCVAHDKNLSTYRLNVLKIDNTPTLSRICKFAYSSLTNSTLSQRERVKYGFTLAEVFSPCRKVKLNFGFTLAEVLITLGIIGIVAALVIPNIVTKYQKHVTVSHLKKAYSIVSQALVSSQAENGDMVEWGLDNAGDFMAGGIDNSAAAYAAITNTYVNKYFIPYLNVADNCGLKCNRQKNIKRYRLNGQQWLWYRHYVVYLKDGMIIAFSFDNVNGLMNTIHTYVDINGDQKPNISGRDIFTFNFNSSTNKVNFAGSEFNRSQLLADWRSCCNKNAGDYSGDYCGALIQLDGWKIAPDYPW